MTLDNTYKTNLDYWQALEKKGLLYSHYKDGTPDGFIEQLMGYAYPVTMIIIFAAIFYFYPKIDKEKGLKPIVAGVGGPTLLGWVWGGWILHTDPVYPAWMFPPWSTSNIEFIMSIEDWVWYPGCTIGFYIIYKLINFNDFSEHRTLAINFVIAFYLLFIVFFLFFTAPCGISVTLLFTLPGFLLFFYAIDVLNIKKFIYFTIILTAINCLWDFIAASWVHNIEGMAWASQWTYITFSQTGEYVHSSVFVDYEKHPWGWIFYSPIEITPGLGFAGAMLNYSFFVATEKYFDQKKSEATARLRQQ